MIEGKETACFLCPVNIYTTYFMLGQQILNQEVSSSPPQKYFAGDFLAIRIFTISYLYNENSCHFSKWGFNIKNLNGFWL